MNKRVSKIKKKNEENENFSINLRFPTSPGRQNWELDVFVLLEVNGRSRRKISFAAILKFFARQIVHPTGHQCVLNNMRLINGQVITVTSFYFFQFFLN